MPKNTACPGVPRVIDPITDQEMAFAHLVLSGTMTDRRAAEAAGLNPETAAYTKSRPRVRAYMIEHRAALREKLVDQEADLSRRAVEGLRKLNLARDQVLGRLWELAHLSPEMTRGSITGQVKALSMIIAIEGLIPDRRLSPSGTQPAAPSVKAQIYESAWLRKQQHQAAPKEPGDPVAAADPQPSEPQSAPGWADGAPPVSGPTPGPTPEPTLDVSEPSYFGAPLNPSPTPSSAPRVPMADYFAPDTRVPFSLRKNPFARRR